MDITTGKQARTRCRGTIRSCARFIIISRSGGMDLLVVDHRSIWTHGDAASPHDVPGARATGPGQSHSANCGYIEQLLPPVRTKQETADLPTVKSRRRRSNCRRRRSTPTAAVDVWPSAYQPVGIAKNVVLGVAKAVGIGYADSFAVDIVPSAYFFSSSFSSFFLTFTYIFNSIFISILKFPT